MSRPWLFLLLALVLPFAIGAGTFRDLSPAEQVQMKSEARVALVIGNGAYASGSLKNPVPDARAVAAALEARGFRVTLVADAGKQRMEEAIIDFGRALKAGGVGLFYYAGHGVELDGANYLVPLEADLSDDAYVRSRAVEVGYVTAEMEVARNRLNIVVLDACRNNPYATRMRSVSRGLATVAGPTGTYIAYSASAGRVAEDGEGRNSPFATALVAHLASPGVDLDAVFNGVRTEVYTKTEGRQTPESRSMVVGSSFYFAPEDTQAPEPAVEAEVVAPDPGVLAVTVRNGGEVRLDGVSRGTVPAYGTLKLKGVSAGRHAVSVGSESQQVEVTPGGVAKVELLGVVAAAPAPAPVAPAASSAGIDWVPIPGESYEMSRSEVTVLQYRACVDAGACTAPGINSSTCNWGQTGREDHPVNCVDWNQATAFARWAGGRLPSEVEWEYAAKGGQGFDFAGSDDVDEVAWYGGNSGGGTHAVCGKKRNGYGLCDMSGNVWEWTSTAEGTKRVYCGGSWNLIADALRFADRYRAIPSYGWVSLGFRLSR